jgi:lipopolysaccharide heptosyltransferase I
MVEAKRILIIRPSALGDVCRSVPVLASLRRAYPSAVIDWVVQTEFADAVSSHPALNSVIAFPRHRFGRWWRNPAALGELVRWCAALRRARYDLVFDIQGLGRSGFIALATGAPRRVGFADAKEFGWIGYNVRHERLARAHAVDQMLALLRAEEIDIVPDMRLYSAQADRQWWAARRSTVDEPGAYAVLAPMTRWVSKQWPAESWAALISPLLESGFQALVLLGTGRDRAAMDRILADAFNARPAPDLRDRVLNLCGATSIGQTMAVIERASLVIANDSAPLHMAVGFDRPCIGLYGPTDPAFVGPYCRPEAVIRGAPHEVAGRVNFRDDSLADTWMRLIAPDRVLDRVRTIVRDPAPRPGAFREPARA